MPHVRHQSLVDAVLELSDRGVRDADNAALHGVAVSTVRRWRRLYQRRGIPRGQTHIAPPCPRCDDAPLDGAAYAELLGWYLGDGYISTGRRGVFNLHVYNDQRYTDLNARLVTLMRTVKHERPIVLEPWQEDVVSTHAADLLRGLFHSDGARIDNWGTRVVAGERKRCDYPRWQFVNASEDIISICTRAPDVVEVPWRRSAPRVVSVSRRDAVRDLDRLVGAKT